MSVYSVGALATFYLNLLAILMPYSGPRVIIHRLRGVKIGKNVLIGFNVTLDNTYPHLITLKDGVSLAGNNLILVHSRPTEYHQRDFEFICRAGGPGEKRLGHGGSNHTGGCHCG